MRYHDGSFKSHFAEREELDRSVRKLNAEFGPELREHFNPFAVGKASEADARLRVVGLPPRIAGPTAPG
jgi:hypothetical protein